MFNIEELKKNNKTSYLAEILERLDREEKEVRGMLVADENLENENLEEMVQGELKSIQEQRKQTEKQI